MADPTTKLQISLIGAHSDGFVKALQANNFDIEQCGSVSDRKKSAVNLSVLALTGEEHTLSESDIDKTLRAGTVLALFGPSRALLETVHKATNTPIDIPSLELADGLPLLVYNVNGVVHVTPNNVPSEAKVQELVRSTLEKDGKAPPEESFSVSTVSVDPHEQAVMSISRAVSMTKTSRCPVSNLEPPSGVIGFKKGTIDNTAHIEITWLAWNADGIYDFYTKDPQYIQKFDLNWYTDFYVYATGADCRGKTGDEFTKAGGLVYTLVIDRGNVRRSSDGAPRFLGPTSGYCGYYFIDWNRTGNFSPGFTMDLLSYQPRDPASQNGTRYNYSIDFQQDMQMLNDNGDSKYTFKAQYSNDFTLEKFQQHAIELDSGVDFSVDYKDGYDHWVDPQLSTDTWYYPGITQWVNREGYEHFIIREDMPADDLPINGLTVLSSSVGKHWFSSAYSTACRAFKSNCWRTTSDGHNVEFQTIPITYGNGNGWLRTLDLTWS
ncbi:hypothetical protein PC9H_006808 [Pleurotus ostreatus]|uniref:Uncharacterized protein n=1 Tax=Pleurotus ostreatus TaxID=5322 RepID=A0A8H7DUF6_PLEOS|nr:uncharacterized protein PC9H_006808 [Pleurotus ostreatus]KAF7431089.1 hypothetical protein PC9H_006808 [Pleurotus ostreatus]